MRKPLIAGNWKMNGTREEAEALIEALKTQLPVTDRADWLVLPPYVYLSSAERLLQGTGIHWGAQNVSAYESGAYTGEISVSMLQSLGCRYVIVGHSERRQLFNEDEATVAAKLERVVQAGLTPIVCLGERHDVYQKGLSEQAIREQLTVLLDLLSDPHLVKNAVFAYEPIWAIGTGLSATPEQIQRIHQLKRHWLTERLGAQVAESMKIVYGGSVKANNAEQILAQPDVDGCLVGGASLIVDAFVKICQASLKQVHPVCEQSP